jgi:hypothetical protein
MKRITPLSVVALILLCWVALLGALYEKGKAPGALLYARIPEETVRFLDNLSEQLDLFLRFDPHIRPKDWQDRLNCGEDPETGLMKIEDDCFVVYFNQGSKPAAQAEKILQWAHEAIPGSEALMGKYPFPADVNQRKLPVYLAGDKEQYTALATRLNGGTPVQKTNSTVGLYFSRYSRMGNLTVGILIAPGVWESDQQAREVLWHEMNHYVYFTLIEYDKNVRPCMWVYEGLAEYFSQERTLQLSRRQVEMCRRYTLSGTFPDYIANYWGGESVYRFMEAHYGETKLKDFIRHTYVHPTDESLTVTFQTDLPRLEGEWKTWLGDEAP